MFTVQFIENHGKLDVIVILLAQKSNEETITQVENIKSLHPDFGTVKIKFIQTVTSNTNK